MTTEERMAQMEKEFFETAKKLACMLVQQAEEAGIDEYLLGCACEMVSLTIKNVTEKSIKEQFGSMEAAEETAKKILEQHIEAETKMKESKGQKIVDIAIAKAQGKTIH